MQLSRVHDVLQLVENAEGKEAAQAIWHALPRSLKMDYVWCKWAYVSGPAPTGDIQKYVYTHTSNQSTVRVPYCP